MRLLQLNALLASSYVTLMGLPALPLDEHCTRLEWAPSRSCLVTLPFLAVGTIEAAEYNSLGTDIAGRGEAGSHLALIYWLCLKKPNDYSFCKSKCSTLLNVTWLVCVMKSSCKPLKMGHGEQLLPLIRVVQKDTIDLDRLSLKQCSCGLFSVYCKLIVGDRFKYWFTVSQHTWDM